jgi:hypothetical protein
MTGDQIWGVVSVIVGATVLLLRKFISTGGQEAQPYEPDNNLATPKRNPSVQGDQRIVITAGLLFLGVGLLFAFGILPRE